MVPGRPEKYLRCCALPTEVSSPRDRYLRAVCHALDPGNRAGRMLSAQEASKIMKLVGWLRRALVALTTLGLVLPGHVLAANTPVAATAAKTAAPVSTVIDVSLQTGGVLGGVVAGQQGGRL